MFADLPGEPDNIRKSPSGGYWVALCFYRDQGKPAVIDGLQNQTALARNIAQTLGAAGKILDMMGNAMEMKTLSDAAKDVSRICFQDNVY